MHWTVMDSALELILLFYTLTSLNNNKELRNDQSVLLLSISHLGKQVNLL